MHASSPHHVLRAGSYVRSLHAQLMLLLLLAGTLAQFRAAVLLPLAPRLPEHAASPGNRPLAFIPNRGQADRAFQFQASGMGGLLSFASNEIVLALPSQSQLGDTQYGRDAIKSHRFSQPGRATATAEPRAVVRLRFDNANSAATLQAGKRLPSTVNYLSGRDPSQWQTNLPTFGDILYRQLYPGIDLQYDGAHGQLKGTYVVAPGADPSQIKWRYEGVLSAAVDARSGDLLLQLPGLPADAAAHLTESAPVAWQEIAGRRVFVDARYVLAPGNVVSFSLGRYDRALPLLIDPALGYYLNYSGGTGGWDKATAIAVDSAGNAYVTGTTYSTNFPVAGAFQSSCRLSAGGDCSGDVFVMKLNPAGDVVYSTYLGGASAEQSNSIAVDSTGNIYVTGYTYSSDFPLANPLQPSVNATACYHDVDPCFDMFVTKLNSAGNQLIYSTYFGGDGDDQGFGIAADNTGNAYIAAQITPAHFPPVAGDQSCDSYAYHACPDSTLIKLNPSGSTMLYKKDIRGSGEDIAYGVALDQSGNAYVGGMTTSADLQTTSGAFRSALNGTHDAFAMKVNGLGDTLYSTYLGGSDYDFARGIAVQGNTAYLTGYTQSLDFPVAGGARQSTLNGFSDAFVAKLNADGSALVYSTYLGGSQEYEIGNSIAVNSAGAAYIAGDTTSPDFPLVAPLFDRFGYGTCLMRNCSDAFVAKLSPGGDALIYSTFMISGSEWDTGEGIAVDSQGNAYFAGSFYHLWSQDTNDAIIAKISGQGGVVQVRDEGGQPVEGAQVYRNGTLAGVTSASGSLGLADLRAGDQLVARLRVEEVATHKGTHSQGSNQDWAYRVYITSMDIQRTEPKPFNVVDPAAVQTLTIKKQNALIGFNVVAALEWDAPASYVDDVVERLRHASAALYDATDGQMLFEQAAVYENGEHWQDADYRIEATNIRWPRVKDNVGQILATNDARIYFQRILDSNPDLDPFSARGMAHEFSHYALGLWDSYVWYDDKGKPHPGTFCRGEEISTNHMTTVNASLMTDPENASEFSMQGVDSLWSETCKTTQQWQQNQKSDWETIVARYSDQAGRWKLLTPLDHSDVVPGPSQIPVADWTIATRENDVNTTCADEILLTAKTRTGAPVDQAEVTLLKADGRLIKQGATDKQGQIALVGVGIGDRMIAQKIERTNDGKPRRSLWLDTPVQCSIMQVQHANSRSMLPMDMALDPIPFEMSVTVSPGSTFGQLDLSLAPEVALAFPPFANVFQNGSVGASYVPLALDPATNLYRGSVTIDPTLGSDLSIDVIASDQEWRTARSITSVGLSQVTNERDMSIPGTEGSIQLYIPANHLSNAGNIAIAPTSAVSALPGYTFLATPVAVSANSNVSFTGSAGLTLAVDRGTPNVDVNAARIYRWDSSTAQWIGLASEAIDGGNRLTVSITSFGTYGIMAPLLSAPQQDQVFLALVQR